MKHAKVAVFGVVLGGVVLLFVSSLVAQGSPSSSERARRQPDTARRTMVLDGRGAHIGVSVDEVAEGVRIAEVDPDSPASRAGLRTGDVVVDVAGERVRSARQFSRLIQESPAGRGVEIGVMRDGKRQTMPVTPESRAFGFDLDRDLIEREVARGMREIEPQVRALEPRLREFRFDAPFDFDFDVDVWPRLTGPRGRLGIQSSELTPELAEYFGAKDGGVLVARVTDDSPASRAGLKVGDVITSVDGDRVRDVRGLVDELRAKDGVITVGIVRDKNETSVQATLDQPRPRSGFRRPA